MPFFYFGLILSSLDSSAFRPVLSPARRLLMLKPSKPGDMLRSLPVFRCNIRFFEEGVGVFWCFLLCSNMWLKPCNSDKSTFRVKKLLYSRKPQNLWVSCSFSSYLPNHCIQHLEYVLSYKRELGEFFSFINRLTFFFPFTL